MIDVSYIEISSWAGISIDAEHCYGKLYNESIKCEYEYDHAIRIKRKLSLKEIRYLNKKDTFGNYKQGDFSDRFNTEEDIIKEAKKIWKKISPKAVLLILGDHGTVQPQLVLAGDEKLKEKINKLFKEAERIGCWDNEKEMDKICDEWEKLVKWGL